MKPNPSFLGPLAAALILSGCTGGLNPKADSNKDGGVSLPEFDSYMKETIFTSFDEDGDGYVTMKEWRRLNPSGPESHFRKADRNGDGRVSRAESDAKIDRDGWMKELFDKIDTDGNGSLSQTEIAAFEDRMAAQPGPTDLDKLKQAAK